MTAWRRRTRAVHPGLLVFALLLHGAAARAETSRERPELVAAREVEARIEAGDFATAIRALETQEFSPLVDATLRGRLALARGDAAGAERAFRRARELAPDHAPLRILLAHALLAGGRLAAAREALAHPGLPATDPAVALLLATLAQREEDPAAAHAHLVAAARRHPDHLGIRRELVLLCARAGLSHEARTWAATLSPAELGRDTALLALQTTRGQPGSLALAEWLAAGFPDDAAVQAELGRSASAAGRLRRAAAAFERATLLGGEHAFEAAEHHRAIGAHRRALAMNARVEPHARRVAQRFDILVEAGRYAQAVAAARELSPAERSPLRRYHLAYAHYALQQYAEATTLAEALEDTPEASRGALLLHAMGRTR